MNFDVVLNIRNGGKVFDERDGTLRDLPPRLEIRIGDNDNPVDYCSDWIALSELKKALQDVEVAE